MKTALVLLNVLLFHPQFPNTKDSVIQDAIARGDLKEVQALLEKNPALANAEEDYFTPLMVAVIKGNEDMVRLLLKYKADPNRLTFYDPPLHTARTASMAKLLLEHGANPELRSNYNLQLTPVQAAEKGRKDVVKVLVDAGAKLDMHAAICLNMEEEVARQLKKEPGLAKSPYKYLFIAVEHHRTKIVEMLLKNGADPNQDFGFVNTDLKGPFTPLSLAVIRSDYECTKLLLEHGAKLNVSAGPYLDNLFLFAVIFCDARFLELMLKQGAAIGTIDDRGGATVLHTVCAAGGREDIWSLGRMELPEIPKKDESVAKARLLLQYKADPNAKTKDGGTPLLFAALTGKKELVDFLLQNGAKLDLCTTCLLGNRQEVEAMIKAKPALAREGPFPMGRSPLHWAAERGDVELIKLLLANQADPNATAPSLYHMDAYGFRTEKENGPAGETPLLVAAHHDQTEAAKLLLTRVKKTDGKDMFGDTPLHHACAGKNAALVHDLLQHGADPNARNRWEGTPLHLAIESKACLELLLAAKADATLKDMGDETAVDRAAAANQTENAELLLSHGGAMHFGTACRLKKYDEAKRLLAQGKLPKKYEHNKHETPLFLACEHGAMPIIEYLLQRGDKVTATDQNSPLHVAARYGRTEVIELLLRHGGNVNLTTYYYGTPLDMACGFAQPEAVALLLKHGADVHARLRDGSTLMHSVGCYLESSAPGVQQRVLACAKLLHQAGAGFPARSSDGKSPLHTAASRGHVDLVAFFLDQGVDVNVRDDEGHTPLWLVVNNPYRKDTAMEALLRKRGGKAE